VARKEWKKFDYHARHVQILLLSQTQPQVSPFVCDRLRQLRKDPLLPALQELRIPASYVGDLRSSLICLSPQLRLIELHNNSVSQPEFFLPFILAIITETPLLTHLILHTQAEVNLERVSELKQLFKLNLQVPTSNLSKALIWKLGELENLSDLRIGLGNAHGWRVGRTSVTTNAYPKLQTLSIRGSPTAITKIMEVMSFASLSSLTLGFNTTNSWNEVFNTLAQKETCITIMSLQSYLAQIHFAFDSIYPLLRLHTLEALDINTESFSICDDKFFRLMSLPNLRILSLPSLSQSKSLTTEVLWHPSKLAPRLAELKMCLYHSGAQVPIPRDMMGINISRRDAHRALHKLSISSAYGNMEDSDVIHLARLLYQAFPNLEIVEGFGSNSYHESWGRVNTFRAALVMCCRESD